MKIKVHLDSCSMQLFIKILLGNSLKKFYLDPLEAVNTFEGRR